jgi:hypothetical protein
MMSEENLRASMNLWEKQERLDSVFDFMREPCWAWGACPTSRSMCTPVAPSRPESDQRSPDEAQELFTDLSQEYPLRRLHVDERAPALSNLGEAGKIKREALRRDVQGAADA